MPFDPVGYVDADGPDLRKPSAEGLIWVLEHWKQSPVGHLKFDFTTPENNQKCGTAGCAMGVARILWGEDRHRVLGNIPHHYDVFMDGQFDPKVTEAVVAGRIRDALAGRPIRYLVAGDRLRSAAEQGAS